MPFRKYFATWPLFRESLKSNHGNISGHEIPFEVQEVLHFLHGVQEFPTVENFSQLGLSPKIFRNRTRHDSEPLSSMSL